MTPDGNDVGQLYLKADAVLQQWYVDTSRLATTLEAIYQAEPTWLIATEKEFIDTDVKRAILANDIVSRVDSVLYASHADGFQRATSPNSDAIVVAVFDTEGSEENSTLGVSYGVAVDADLSQLYVGVLDLISKLPTFSKSEAYFRLSELLNEKYDGIVEIYLDSFFAAFDSSTREEFVHTNAHNLAHELGHHLNLFHTAATLEDGRKVAISGENLLDPFDIMAQGTDFSGTRRVCPYPRIAACLTRPGLDVR